MSKNKIAIPKVDGIVKWFDDAKGYGFILYKDVDHFIYYKDIKMRGHKTLEKDQRVKFIPAVSAKGKPIAIEVEVNEKDSITMIKINDTSSEEKPRNSGYVEADFKKGVVILKPTDEKENNIDKRTIRKL